MSPEVPRWLFICSRSDEWTWRCPYAFSEGFAGLDEAVENAIQNGFDPALEYWTTTWHGHTTHYRPGEAPVTLSAENDPL